MSGREILKKRVGPDGAEVDCEDNTSPWVDIKETKRAKYERGSGPAYQKTIYTHLTSSELRQYDDEPKITFKNPRDESQKIEYLKTKGHNHGTIKRITVEAGQGPHYQKTNIYFINDTEDTTRKTRVQRVKNKDTGDYIDVERVENFRNDWGSGPSYQKKVVTLLNTEEEIEQSDGPCKFGNGG